MKIQGIKKLAPIELPDGNWLYLNVRSIEVCTENDIIRVPFSSFEKNIKPSPKRSCVCL